MPVSSNKVLFIKAKSGLEAPANNDITLLFLRTFTNSDIVLFFVVISPFNSVILAVILCTPSVLGVNSKLAV